MNDTGGFFYNIISFTGKSILKGIEIGIGIFVKEPPVIDTRKFEWVTPLEENYQLIKAEYLAISEQKLTRDISEISYEQKKVVDAVKWKFFPLYVYGIPIEKNIGLCPETNRLLQSIPNVTTAFFSVLSPDTFIKEHRGAYKGYLRFHLGVQIPENYTDCGIKIQEQTYHWQNGKSFIFDDTFLHEAWNKSNENRVVLYVDFIRPMPSPFVWISHLLTRLISVSPYVQNALKNLSNTDDSKSVTRVLG